MHGMVVLAGQTRGGGCSKQIKAGSDESQARAGMRRDGAGGLLGHGAQIWRRVRARSMADGQRRGNAFRQGFRGQL